MSDSEEPTADDIAAPPGDNVFKRFVPKPTGKNQHTHCRECSTCFQGCLVQVIVTAPANDDRVADILRDYHRKNITNKKTISKLLRAEHGIQMRYLYCTAAG